MKNYGNRSDDALRKIVSSHKEAGLSSPAQPAQTSQPPQQESLEPPPANLQHNLSESVSSPSREPMLAKSRNAFTEQEDAALLEALGHDRQPTRSWFEAFAQSVGPHTHRTSHHTDLLAAPDSLASGLVQPLEKGCQATPRIKQVTQKPTTVDTTGRTTISGATRR